MLTWQQGVSQNVPNGGFETWDKEDHFLLDEWITYGMAERTTDASSKEYALKLHNYKNAAGNFVSSSLFNVDWQNGSVDKFPYNGDPLSMVFDTKHILAQGDTGYVFAGFYEKGQYIGQANISLNGSTGDDYVSYSVPIVWYSFSRTPDSVFIGIQSDLKNDTKGQGFIIIDDFRFENIGQRTVEVNNYDFENWTNLGVVYPNKWMSIDLVSFRDWGAFLRNPSVVETEQPFRGTNSLRIQNFESWTAPDAGFCFTGSTTEESWRPSFPVDKKYKYLQGYYKYNNGGGDTAEVSLNMFIAGNYLADGTIRFVTATDKWQFFSIPINYYLDLKPDSATIRMFSATDGSSKSVTTVFQVDELKFVDELNNTIGIKNEQANELAVYPNPFTNSIDFMSDGGTFLILNSNGQLIQKGSLTTGKNNIQLNSYESGLYFLKIQDNNHKQWQQKIIKQ